LTDITDNDVANLVAWRRGHRRKDHRKNPPKDAPPLPFIAPATVNRSTTEVLKKLFTRAKAWSVRFDHEPDWKRHWLKEPQERTRELRSDEAESLDENTRNDYEPIMSFARATGMRLKECLLRWSEVDWGNRIITKKGKGDRRVTFPISSDIRAILWPLQGHHDEFVFTYVAKRTRKAANLVKGSRYPITYSGLKSAWKRMRSGAGLEDFRFHDIRHDFATKKLRATGNLKAVSRLLNHADIKTTMRYAHVTDDDLRDILEQTQSPERTPEAAPSTTPKQLKGK
jgi:integrase